MYEESSTIELKRQVTDGLKKEVIAFMNTNGGTIVIGVEDDGSVIGLPHARQDLESISSMLRDSIKPDVLVYTKAEIISIEGKDVIEIEIARGTRRPYHLASKGIKPSRVFVRHGTTVNPASNEAIRKMIMESDGTSFENIRCMNQTLAFDYAKKLFAEEKLSFGQTQQRTLGIVNEEGYYTNLGLLLSEQCEHTVKCARYQGTTKLEFRDRKEFGGSLLKQVNDVYDYLQMHNASVAEFNGLQRIETSEYPSDALREALINAVVHRDYGFSGSILIHIFDDRIEIVSVGGLVQGLSVEDIELGISQSRNSKLANCFYRLKWIESYGTGLQRIRESYAGVEQEPFWEIGPNAFVVTLPKKDLVSLKKNQGVSLNLMSWIKQHETFTSKELENHLDRSKSSVRQLITELVASNVIERVGRGRATKYRAKL
ncbi:RNA-binding domain-containing protein [Sporosarcina beigongshangi]|uniref:RNA-binding domain-containing protein n=1 Tax=Sporosarcina beigongshangi TaxID=2782538 RepID=UPI00193999F9|nr:RNA-binding domain-containing protein [Sporosarcina beigongshangi]